MLPRDGCATSLTGEGLAHQTIACLTQQAHVCLTVSHTVHTCILFVGIVTLTLVRVSKRKYELILNESSMTFITSACLGENENHNRSGFTRQSFEIDTHFQEW